MLMTFYNLYPTYKNIMLMTLSEMTDLISYTVTVTAKLSMNYKFSAIIDFYLSPFTSINQSYL